MEQDMRKKTKRIFDDIIIGLKGKDALACLESLEKIQKDFLQEQSSLDVVRKKISSYPLRYRIIYKGFCNQWSLGELNASLREKNEEPLYARDLIEASLIYAFQKQLTFSRWHSLIVQIRELESDGSYDEFLINGFNGSYSAFPLVRVENYVQMNSRSYAETMYTLQRTLTVERNLEKLGENQEFVSYMCENIRMFCDGREKSRYYICKYFLFYLNTKIKYYMASDKNRRIKRNIYLDLPLSNISKMDPNRHAHMSEEEIKECLMTAKISSNKLFELLNRFYSYILLSDSEANDPNWEEYSFMHRILQGDRISRSLLLLMVLFFGSEAELPDPGLVLTVRRMNEILQACRFQVLDENAGEDSLDSFLLTVLCSDDKKAAVDKVIGQMESMQL